jgi:hypothetical protein
MAIFSEVTADIIQKKQTGLLSVIVKNGKHHLKIFFSDGEVYYVAYGDLKDAECMEACENFELSEFFFASGVRVTAKEKCCLSTSAIITQLRKCIDKSEPPGIKSKNAGDPGNFSVIRDKLKVAIIRQVGPVGEILFSSILDEWRPSSPPTRQQLVELIDLMKERIEDEKSKKEFTNEANAIIS